MVDIVEYFEFILKELIINYELVVLNVIVCFVEGGMWDVLSIFDQVILFSEGMIILDDVM